MNYASVNTVYNLCKEILAKDERGFLNVSQFNMYARDAQNILVSKLISGHVEGVVLKNQYIARQSGVFSVIDSNKNDLLPLLRKGVSLSGSNNVFDFPSDYLIHEGRDSLTVSGNPSTIADEGKEAYMINSYLSPPTRTVPVSVFNYNSITVYPDTITSGVALSYYKIPQGSTVAGQPSTSLPTWGYTTVSGKSIYNSSSTINFELPVQCEDRLVKEILQMAGMALREIEVYQFADKESAEATQEKNS